MFKVGEQVVMTDADDYNSIFIVVGQPFRMYQLKGPDDLFYGRLDIQIRHATPEEIAAGHRIESSNSQAISNCSISDLSKNERQSDLSIKQEGQDAGDLEDLRDCDTSPNCKKFDERVNSNETK